MNIKQKIWEKLDKDGYCLDCDLAKIYGGEVNYYVAEEYKKAWRKFNSDKAEFADKEIVAKEHIGRKYLVQVKGMDKNSWYQVGKDFYNEIKI